MTVRPATPADWQALSSIQVSTWRDAYSDLFDEGFLKNLVVAESRWQEKADAGVKFLVAEEDGQVVGYCSFSIEDQPGWAELRAVYVDPSRQGRGHGSALISSALASLVTLGVNWVFLWVFERNESARTFYAKTGWHLKHGLIRLETIGGSDLTLVRYERATGTSRVTAEDPRGM